MNFCGIDFGTSNSAIAASDGAHTRLVPLEGGQVTIPSAIFFNTEDKKISFGRAAVGEYLNGYEGRLMRALKSILGSSLIGETTKIGASRADFKDIIGMLVAHIKNTAQANTGTELTHVVMGRPVRFVDDDDAADARAQAELQSIALAQGFKDVSFEYEPLAAARVYERDIKAEELVLVVDIGGGTSDFSVLRLMPEHLRKPERRHDILANEGVHIGGTDFDKKFSLATVMRDLGYKSQLQSGLDMPSYNYFQLATWHLINFLYNQKTISEVKSLCREAAEPEPVERFLNVIENRRGHELAESVERAKIALSQAGDFTMDLGFIDRGWQSHVSADDLTRSVTPDVARIIACGVETVTRAAGLKTADIDAIFMTGGSTALPGFTRAVQAAFPASAIRQGDRHSSVAEGLGLAAAERYR